jgi:hypothetical protein
MHFLLNKQIKSKGFKNYEMLYLVQHLPKYDKNYGSDFRFY